MNSSGTFTTTITPAYAARRDTLQTGFPAAHEFLCALEALAAHGRFHLGTVQNFHLYDGRSFLCYVRIKRPGPGRPSMVLSSEPNQGQIKIGTQAVEGPAFVQRVVHRIMDLRGFHHWAEQKGAEVTLTADTPTGFFDGVLDDLRTR